MLSCDVGARAWGKATKERHLGDHRGRHDGARFRAPRCGRQERQTVGSQGHPVVVYFYPKDDTSGCTAEAKDFTCLAGGFHARPAPRCWAFLPTARPSHRKFQEKYGLDVRLLSDEARSAAEAYGVWVEKSMYGRKYMGVERATFLIDKAGKIARSWRNVRVPGHAEEVLEAARSAERLGEAPATLPTICAWARRRRPMTHAMNLCLDGRRGGFPAAAPPDPRCKAIV